eukprot:TRINITY_DN21776_c0_g1_i1.p1 TRINITY_DN21776_c0_g1~~TRINITY_DN21776_c0_g1_i1.p1  ORF type:complete len:570 (-),score=92.78 TRINITY_DN21776_c0_g1_i1:64-1773(-)
MKDNKARKVVYGKRVERVGRDCVGWLVGYSDRKGDCVVLSVIDTESDTIEGIKWDREEEFVAGVLPGGLYIVGLFATELKDADTIPNQILSLVEKKSAKAHFLAFSSFLFACRSEESLTFLSSMNEKLPAKLHNNVQKKLSADMLMLHTKVTFSELSKEDLRSLATGFEEGNAAFLFKGSSSFLLQGRSASKETARLSTFFGKTSPHKEIVIYECKSANEIKSLSPPEIRFDKSHKQQILLHNLDFRAICYVPWWETLAEAVSVMTTFIAQTMTSVDNRNDRVSNLIGFHFQPEDLPHILRQIYAVDPKRIEIDEENLGGVRTRIHKKFHLQMDRPLLRSPNAIDANFSGQKEKATSQKLVNVHLGCPSKGGAGGKVSFVQGDYEYYHYMQDNFNDTGWGCAYRSLQTICSWMRMNGYARKAVPDHAEIQRTLVELGDRDPSFEGSKQWIGAIEVQKCLTTFFGINCRIVHVSSGKDVCQHAETLYNHFEKDGTPIMIGGGVLAWTLLAIDWNEDTGDTQFLILDPHYTGLDDQKRACKGGNGCGWKPASVFRADAFYNFCLPLRPRQL